MSMFQLNDLYFHSFDSLLHIGTIDMPAS